jgi:exosome complex component CSL4
MKQPGDKLGSAMEYMPGSGVYEINGELIAGVCGELKEDNETMKMSIIPSVSTPIEIKEGDTVFG